MFVLSVNISADVSGSYSIEPLLDEVHSKLLNVYRKIKDLESIMLSCKLNPYEIDINALSGEGAQGSGENKSKSDVSLNTSSNVYVNGIFMVYIPPEVIDKLNECLDIRHTLEVTGRGLVDQLDEQKKRKYQDLSSHNINFLLE